MSRLPPGVGAALLLWQESSGEPPAHDNVLLWQGPACAPGARSLTEFVERRAVEVRRCYLAWVHDLGQVRVRGRRLCERFSTRAGSLWALSPFVEQSRWKQPSLETILKVMALELLLREERPGSVHFCGADRRLRQTLRMLCRELGIRYTSNRAATRSWSSAGRRLLPSTVSGLATFAYLLVNRFALPRPPSRPDAGGAGTQRALFCAPFFNHNASADSGRDFVSYYWMALPRMLVLAGWQLHWLHTFYPHGQIPHARAAARTVCRIGAESPWSGTHSFVDAYVGPGDFPRLLWQWVRVGCESWLVGRVLSRNSTRRVRESYWPLLRADWANAWRGPRAALTLFYSEAFESALRRLPCQNEGIYLMENQDWERALIRAWRRHGHGRLTAVAHSTVRFWDLRYHCDPRRYSASCRSLLPEPDVVALNGPAARRAYLATSPDRERLADCEALRYLHLVPRNTRPFAAGETLRLLVLGDFMGDASARLLSLLERALRELEAPLEIWLKPHPNCPVDARRYPGLPLRVIEGRVADLVSQAHLVLASNTTSAALEAYISGGRVTVYDDRREVNFSPLRDVRDALFVHSAPELVRAIALLRAGACEPERRAAEFFTIDPALPRWREYFHLGSRDGHDATVDSSGSRTKVAGLT